MKNIEFIVNFKEDRAYITPEHSLNLEQVDIPPLIKSFPNPVSLIYKIKRFVRSENRIKAEIINYNLSLLPFSKEQLAFSEELAQIKRVVWTNLNNNTLLFIHNYKLPDGDTIPLGGKLKGKESVNVNIFRLNVAVKDLVFYEGYAKTKQYIKVLNRELNLFFYNKVLTPSFNLLAHYLYRELQNRALRVQFEIVKKEDGREEVNAYADIINNISISKIRKYRFLALKKNLHKDLSDYKGHLFLDFEHYFSLLFGTKYPAKEIYQKENDFILDIVENLKSAHPLKIKFLLKHHAFKVMKMRYIPDPYSLLFLIEKKKKYFLVWETIKMRKSTDIWYIEKDAEQINEVMNEIPIFIKTIKEKGKKELPKEATQNHKRIGYNYSSLLRGFDLWKQEINYFMNKKNEEEHEKEFNTKP